MIDFDDLAVLAASAGRVSELTHGGDLSTPAVGLGRWTVRDIVAHLGGVHRWATRVVETRSMDGPGVTKSTLDGDELCEWFDEGADLLVGTLAAVDPDEPCPNFNPGSADVVAWWRRRQTHETVVHAWDVENAFGVTTPIDPAIAADAVDEFLDTYIRTRGTQTLTEPLILTSDGPDRSWTLSPAEKPGRIDISSGRADGVETEISGSAEHLLLHLWRRRSLGETDLVVSGSADVAASFRDLG